LIKCGTSPNSYCPKQSGAGATYVTHILFKMIANPGAFAEFGENDTSSGLSGWEASLKKGILVTGKDGATGDIKGFMNTASTATNYACYVDDSFARRRR